MKKLFTAAALFTIAICALAQLPEVKIFPESTVGKNIATQEDIKAKEYIFPERIYDVHIDTVSQSIVVQLLGLRSNGLQLKNRGELLVYDMVGEKVKWSKKIAYQNSRIYSFGSTVIHKKTGINNKINSLDIETGKKQWKAVNSLSLINHDTQTGIGYKQPGGYSNTVEGINLQTGKTLWQREINREYGWDDVFQLNDSVWMIVAAGLHTVNDHDGSGWTHHAITGKKDYTAAIAVNAAGAVLGLLTGTFVFTTGHDMVTGIHSNVYSDSAGYYFASKEKLSRIRKNEGGDFWYNLLPPDSTAKSSIFAKADTLYMINHGYAFMNGRQICFGVPFFAAFDRNSGWRLFYHPFDGYKKNPVLDFKIENNSVLLVFKDRIMKRSLTDGSLLLEKLIDNAEFGELQFMAANRVYIDAGNPAMTNLLLSDTTKNFIFSTKEKVLMFDAELNITGSIDKNQLCAVYKTAGDYKFVMKDSRTIVMDAGNRKVVEINTKRPVFTLGNKLYAMSENTLFEIDMTDIY
ncbi:MAG: hypothetical protein LBV41_07095 [Cytophagaceae bacterium]|jgi:hypothetical protein|nr:hypothetical protein [Cytophagaceae bacterium]